MEIVLAILGVSYAAFCIWLTVRIVNRRERWAKRMLAVMAAVPVLYVLSSGPMTMLAFRSHQTLTATTPGGPVQAEMSVNIGEWWPRAYAPLMWASDQSWGEPLWWYWGLFPVQSATEKS